MGDTTITVDDTTKERLETDHRADGHYSYDEQLNGMMEMLPTVEEMKEGCANCDTGRLWQGTPEDTGGVIVSFHTEFDGDDVYGATYFCSESCAMEMQEEMQKQIPSDPDEVLVGGADQFRSSFEGATFHIDQTTMEVGIPVPGAFSGQSMAGTEYDYEGEPVYIRNDGQVVQDGVIEDIIHEEGFTTLLLSRSEGYDTVMLNHPNEEKRQNYEENHVEWTGGICPGCETEVRFPLDGEEDECPECESVITEETVLELTD